MKCLGIAALFALGAALSGCASIVEGSTQSVAVTTAPADGAQCTLTNSEGTWYVTTPGNATVHKTKHDLNVICKKQGYRDASISISPHFNGATFGNVIAGGVVGIGVDAATGANYNYQPLIAIPMSPMVAMQGDPASSITPAPATSAPAAGGIISAHVDLTQPHPDPLYPDSAQVNGEQGTVMIDVYVNSSGRPTKARVAQSSGFADLDNSAIECVLNWRFVPASHYGEGVSDWTKVQLAFRLPEAAASKTPASQPIVPQHP